MYSRFTQPQIPCITLPNMGFQGKTTSACPGFSGRARRRAEVAFWSHVLVVFIVVTAENRMHSVYVCCARAIHVRRGQSLPCRGQQSEWGAAIHVGGGGRAALALKYTQHALFANSFDLAFRLQSIFDLSGIAVSSKLFVCPVPVNVFPIFAQN